MNECFAMICFLSNAYKKDAFGYIMENVDFWSLFLERAHAQGLKVRTS